MIAAPRRRSRQEAAARVLEQMVVDDYVLTEIVRHGPRTGAELIVAASAAPAEVIDAAMRLMSCGLLRIESGRFTLKEMQR